MPHSAAGTWLHSNLPGFEYIHLLEAFCKPCNKPVMGFCYCDSKMQAETALQKIERRDHDAWLLYKKAQFHMDANSKASKDTRPLVFVGQFTLDSAKDPAGKIAQQEKLTVRQSALSCLYSHS